MNNLDGIDHQHPRLVLVRGGDNRLYVGLGHQSQLIGGQPSRWARMATCCGDSSPVIYSASMVDAR